MARLDLVNYLLGQGLRKGKLKGEQFHSCCPFHGDDAPSFSVNVKNGKWLCRSASCGKRGTSIVSLIAKLENISYKKAAEKAGVRAPIESEDELNALLGAKSANKKVSLSPPLPPCVSVTQRYPQYLLDRRYEPACGAGEAWDLRVGIRDSSDVLYKGRFSEYLIIPVYDFKGNYLSFTARYMGSDKSRLRYNGPEFPLKDYLYGEWQLSPGDGPVYLVEGPFDTMRLWTFGETALGTFGTSYTYKQIKRICDLTGSRPLIVCYDANTLEKNGSVEAVSVRLLSTLKSLGRSCTIFDVSRSNRKDIDEFDLPCWRTANLESA